MSDHNSTNASFHIIPFHLNVVCSLLQEHDQSDITNHQEAIDELTPGQEELEAVYKKFKKEMEKEQRAPRHEQKHLVVIPPAKGWGYQVRKESAAMKADKKYSVGVYRKSGGDGEQHAESEESQNEEHSGEEKAEEMEDGGDDDDGTAGDDAANEYEYDQNLFDRVSNTVSNGLVCKRCRHLLIWSEDIGDKVKRHFEFYCKK